MDTQNISKHPSSQGNLLTECITWCNIQPYLYFQNHFQRKVWEIFHKTEQKAKNVTQQPAGMLVGYGEMRRSRVKSSESDPNTSLFLRWHNGKCGTGSRGSLPGLKKQHRSTLPLRSTKGFITRHTHTSSSPDTWWNCELRWSVNMCWCHLCMGNTDINGNRGEGT